MFTIKHRAADGTETIHQAETVEVVPPGIVQLGAGAPDVWNWESSGIFLDRSPSPEYPNEPRTAKHIILFGGDHTAEAEARKGGKVWIMNEAGNTVADYTL